MICNSFGFILHNLCGCNDKVEASNNVDHSLLVVEQNASKASFLIFCVWKASCSELDAGEKDMQDN